MNALLHVAALAAAGFFRLGRHWTKEGVVIHRDEFTDAEWAVLTAEPALRIAPAPAGAEVEAAGARSSIDLIKAVLGDLAAEDFQKDGKPKLDALKAKLPDLKVTAELRDAAWAEANPPKPD